MEAEKILFELEMEISNQQSNDWSSKERLQYYIKGLQYAIELIKKEKGKPICNYPNIVYCKNCTLANACNAEKR